jgi:hypothetical protein
MPPHYHRALFDQNKTTPHCENAAYCIGAVPLRVYTSIARKSAGRIELIVSEVVYAPSR